MRGLVLAVCLLGSAGMAAAQAIEVGGRVGAGCVGNDGSICGGGTSPLAGGHAALWFDDRVEISASAARVALDSFAFRATDDPYPIDIEVTDRSRDLVSVLFVYHFMKGSPVRPMLGIGSGWYSDAERVACQPAGCSTQLRGGPLLGQYREWDVDAVFVVGLSGIIADRWVVRGGWQSHRLGNDENMTQQLFVGAGYRFGQ
jgi:hypothetical protein